jgi:hypothetical protein
LPTILGEEGERSEEQEKEQSSRLEMGNMSNAGIGQTWTWWTGTEMGSIHLLDIHHWYHSRLQHFRDEMRLTIMGGRLESAASVRPWRPATQTFGCARQGRADIQGVPFADDGWAGGLCDAMRCGLAVQAQDPKRGRLVNQ